MNDDKFVVWPAVAAAFLCLIDAALRLSLNPWEGYSVILNDPGKTFFHLFVLPSILLILGKHYRWHHHLGIGPTLTAKLALVALIAVAAIGAVAETRHSFMDRLTAAEDLADHDLRASLATTRVDLRQAVTDQQKKGSDARDESKQLATKLVHKAMWSDGNWVQAMSLRRVTAMLLSALGYGLTAYVIWLLAVTASGVFPWKSTRGYLFLTVTLLSIWPLLNGYSEIWRNFGFAPNTNPAQKLALLMLGFTFLLTMIAFYRSEAEDLVSKLVDSAKYIASGAPSALVYKWSDPTPIYAVFGNDDLNFAVAQLFAGSLLIVVVVVFDSRIRGQVTARSSSP